MNDCLHVDKNGENTIIFETKKWTGIHPKKIKGFCVLCKQTIEVTENEYREIMKEGDLI